MTNPLLEAALKYAEMGFCVVPLAKGTRVPPKGFPLSKYFNEKPTKETLISWIEQYPKCNIGIVTGQISGLCVVDLDKDKDSYDENVELQYFPDTLITPTSKTPSGGNHLYFRTPNGTRFSSKSDVLPAIDFKCDDAYIVAPPSILHNGLRYEWADGMSLLDVDPADLPLSFLDQIILNNNKVLYRDVTSYNAQTVTDVTSRYIWDSGTRDDNLYYVAQCLADCGAEPRYISQVLQAIVSSWGEKDDKWVSDKVKSAINHLSRKERNWQEDVDGYISVTDGTFSVTDCYHTLQAVTKQNKGAVRIALNRRKDKTIQKVGTKDGTYTKIEQSLEFIEFDDKEELPYPVDLPMGLNNLVEISSGNLIIVAGEYNAGKTTFLLNVLSKNKNRIPIRYLSSEMDGSEFKKRFKGFGLPLNFWKPDDMTDFVKLKANNDYHHCLKPDGLNIIDYLEFRDSDYTLGAEIMKKIHDALGAGICIIGIQKKEGTRLPRSGDLVLEKPRLAISLSKASGEREVIVAEILKAKMTRMGKCDGKRAMYEIKDFGATLKEERSWGYWK